MKTLVGPIIGKVTDTTARVLLEYDSPGEVAVTLSTEGQQDKTITQNLEARRPTIFNFTNLIPNVKYNVKVSPQSNTLTSSFRTMDYSVKNLRVAWVSCNDASKNAALGERNLWHKLAQEVKEQQYDYVVHMGDQVYLDSDQWYGNKDNVYTRVQDQVFKKYPKNEWPNHQEQVLEIIRDEYRRAWNFPQTAYILANIPNVMILDDHEVRNRFAFLPEDWETNTDKFDYYYGQQCRQVYYEYERQLHDETLDLKDLSKTKEEYFTLQLGKVGFFFCELRGDRSWHRTKNFDDNKVMTQKQWDKLDNYLAQDCKDVENFVFVSQSTVVFLKKDVNSLFGKVVPDYYEQWVNDEDSQYKVLKKLYDWKFNPQFKNREVTIVCGDLHLGGHTDIYFKKKKAFKQFTSSAITNGLKPGFERIVHQIGQTISEAIKEGDFSYDHHGWVGKNNYGAIHFRNTKKNIVECWSVVAKDAAEVDAPNFTVRAKIDNYKYINDKCDCCSIF